MTQPTDAQAFLSSLESLECAICMEGYDANHRPIIFECRHIFGENCVRRWIESGNGLCPNCRAPLHGEETVVPASEEVQPPPIEVPTGIVREDPVVPTSQEIPQLPMEVLADFIREDNMVRWSQEPQQRPVQVPTDFLQEDNMVRWSQEPEQGLVQVPTDFIREDSMVRWSQEPQQRSVQEPQQRPVQVSTDVMRVIARQSDWDVLVNQRMRWLVSRSERLVASLLRLPGQAGVKLGLLRRNGADDRSANNRPRKRLQRNPELHPQAQDTRRIVDAARRTRSDRGDTHQATREPIGRTDVQRLTNARDRHSSRSHWQALLDRATPSRVHRRRQEDQDREYAQLLQRTYDEQDGSYEAYDDDFDMASRPTYSIRDGVHGTREPPSNVYTPQRFRNAGLNGLYDSVYEFY